MATGTGKTITAIGCFLNSVDSAKQEVIVISSPFIHLIKQWEKIATSK